MRRISGTADNVTTDVVLIAAAGIGIYFLVIKPLLGSFGIDPADQATITNQMNLPASQNPFNFQFQPFVDFYNENTPTVDSGQNQTFMSDIISYMNLSPQVTTLSNPTMQQFFVAVKQIPPVSSPWSLLDINKIISLGNSLNAFITTADNAKTVFAQLSNQLEVAALAAYSFFNYDRDLLSYLQGGGGILTGLAPHDLATIINNVNALPINPNV